MKINHIFIFSDHNGKEADELVEFGLVEGSNRVHHGQGTINRKFYFENFFLEIAWVNNESEIKSELTSKTKLWERSQYKSNENSPFGLCLDNTDDTDQLFKDCIIYQPNYSPEGMVFGIITNEKLPFLPWTCRLPFEETKKIREEPIHHKYGIRKLTKVVFGIPFLKSANNFISFFDTMENLTFEESVTPNLTLEFNEGQRQRSQSFKDLNLQIEY